MKVPQFWKIKREVWRIWLRIKVAAIRLLGLKIKMRYAGLDIPLNREGMSGEVVMGIASGLYERPEISGLSRVLRQGDRVLELGAGLGVVTAISSRLIGPEGEILAFEADPKLIKDTNTFLQDHGILNVEIRNAVLVPSEFSGTTRDFHVARVFAVSSLVSNEGRTRGKTITVPAVCANNVISQFKPDVLICDIEGGEAELIPALNCIGIRAVVIEMHPRRVTSEALSVVRSTLESQGLIKVPANLGGTVELFSRVSM